MNVIKVIIRGCTAGAISFWFNFYAVEGVKLDVYENRKRFHTLREALGHIRHEGVCVQGL